GATDPACRNFDQNLTRREVRLGKLFRDELRLCSFENHRQHASLRVKAAYAVARSRQHAEPTPETPLSRRQARASACSKRSRAPAASSCRPTNRAQPPPPCSKKQPTAGPRRSRHTTSRQSHACCRIAPLASSARVLAAHVTRRTTSRLA